MHKSKRANRIAAKQESGSMRQTSKKRMVLKNKEKSRNEILTTATQV